MGEKRKEKRFNLFSNGAGDRKPLEDSRVVVN